MTIVEKHYHLLLGFHTRLTNPTAKVFYLEHEKNIAFAEGVEEAEEYLGLEFTIPEINALFDEETYIRVIDHLTFAATVYDPEKSVEGTLEHLTLTVLRAAGLGQGHHDEVVEAITAMRLEGSPMIKCECCADNGEDRLAVTMAPSSTDLGRTITYAPICSAHAQDWWDGADWDGRHLHQPIYLQHPQGKTHD